MASKVDDANFTRAETNRMFAGLQKDAGGVNQWKHLRAPTAIDEQTVIRMNRDTLYSLALVDISQGATVTVPDAGDRYLSVMVINQDHYINRIFTEPGTFDLTVEEFDTPYVALGARVLVDASDPDDVANVNEIQDGFSITARASEPFVLPEYDEGSFTATREKWLAEAAKGMPGTHGMFGTKEEVDPRTHRIGTAAGWGGLPEREAFYISVEPHLPVGAYQINVEDVPVDAFWSVTLYNADGFFQKNDYDAYSVNNITGVKNDDGSVTVNLGGNGDQPNSLPLTEGWNYLVRMYRPRPEVLDGTWAFPALEAVGARVIA
ncbi:MAG: hypothetical protein QOF53_2931 [Nocardioidaceae bacterium]|nr:hypothetical protein [Nocardioidaceae bacterium]